MKHHVLLILVTVLAAILRFWQLGTIPPSLNWDEASNAYNAYSILKTARDEYGNFMPTTFRSFGDYNPAMSVYTIVPALTVFGATDFAVRFPSAFLGTITVMVTYLLVLELTKNKKVALMSSFFLAISPWHLQFSRYDHEANFMITFAILGLLFLLYALKNYPQKTMCSLTISAIFFGLALNSYQGSKIWVPLFIITTAIFFFKEIKKVGKKIFLPLLILFIFSLPYLLNLEQTLIRGQSVGILHNPEGVNLFVTGYLSHFSLNFLFASADNIGRHAVPGMGEEYIFELPLIIIGLLSVIKSKSQNSKFLLAWLLIAPIPVSLATPTPHALRAITFLPLWSIFAAMGLATLISSSLNSNAKKAILGVLFIVAVYNLITYFHVYYKHYPKEKAADWQYGYRQMVEYVNSVKDNFDVVAISNYYGRPYIFVLFYSKYDPSLYQKHAEDKDKFDKFEFFGSSWDKKTTGKALVVRPWWQNPNPPPEYLKEIKDTNGEVVFRISSE